MDLIKNFNQNSVYGTYQKPPPPIKNSSFSHIISQKFRNDQSKNQAVQLPYLNSISQNAQNQGAQQTTQNNSQYPYDIHKLIVSSPISSPRDLLHLFSTNTPASAMASTSSTQILGRSQTQRQFNISLHTQQKDEDSKLQDQKNILTRYKSCHNLHMESPQEQTTALLSPSQSMQGQQIYNDQQIQNEASIAYGQLEKPKQLSIDSSTQFNFMEQSLKPHQGSLTSRDTQEKIFQLQRTPSIKGQTYFNSHGSGFASINSNRSGNIAFSNINNQLSQNLVEASSQFIENVQKFVGNQYPSASSLQQAEQEKKNMQPLDWRYLSEKFTLGRKKYCKYQLERRVKKNSQQMQHEIQRVQSLKVLQKQKEQIQKVMKDNKLIENIERSTINIQDALNSTRANLKKQNTVYSQVREIRPTNHSISCSPDRTLKTNSSGLGDTISYLNQEFITNTKHQISTFFRSKEISDEIKQQKFAQWSNKFNTEQRTLQLSSQREAAFELYQFLLHFKGYFIKDQPPQQLILQPILSELSNRELISPSKSSSLKNSYF